MQALGDHVPNPVDPLPLAIQHEPTLAKHLARIGNAFAFEHKMVAFDEKARVYGGKSELARAAYAAPAETHR